MSASKVTYTLPDFPSSVLREDGIESGFTGKLQGVRNQVYTVQQMVKSIDDDECNGFVWHTTGSGKTLTSFKASTLATLRHKLLPNLQSGRLNAAHLLLIE